MRYNLLLGKFAIIIKLVLEQAILLTFFPFDLRCHPSMQVIYRHRGILQKTLHSLQFHSSYFRLYQFHRIFFAHSFFLSFLFSFQKPFMIFCSFLLGG